jgi:predicted anti-sigma-YlaC factor YlaD
LALVVVAGGVGLLALPALVFGRAEAAAHVAHELGALNLALAGALLLAAIRPARAAGLLPVFGVVVVLLLVTAGDDLARGFTSWRHESAHALMIVGFVLLVCLARLESGRRPAPSGPDQRRPDSPNLSARHDARLRATPSSGRQAAGPTVQERTG